MNKLLFILFASLAFLTVSGSIQELRAEACPPRPPELKPQELAANARDHGFLWRISKDGRSSYLYGTIHVGQPEWLFPGPAVSGAIRDSNTIALELDLLDESLMADLQQDLAEAVIPVLPDTLKKRLEQHFQKVCLSYDVVKQIAPELQIAMLQMELGRWSGMHPEFAIDPFLSGIGRGANITVVSLETPQQQLVALQHHQRFVGFARVGGAQVKMDMPLEAARQRESRWVVVELERIGRHDEIRCG
jgi:hypothetical protein